MQTCPQCGNTWDESAITFDSAPANSCEPHTSTTEESTSVAEETISATEESTSGTTESTSGAEESTPSAEEPASTPSDATASTDAAADAVAEAPPSAWLRPVEGGPATRVISPMFIGRVSDCQLVIDDLNVSRKHCVIFLYSDGARLEDLGSENGTLVNDRAVVTTPLVDGDIIQLAGRHRLRFSAKPDAQHREKTSVMRVIKAPESAS